MTGQDLISRVRQESKTDAKFIRWWRKENDFADYQLLSDFEQGVLPGVEYGGFELLTLEQMWQALQSFCPDKVSRKIVDEHEMIVWNHTTSDGEENRYVCPLTAKTIMDIFNVETRGNPIV